MALARLAVEAPGRGEIDVLDPAFWQDLPGATGRCRERHPLAYAPALESWLVLRHHDVARLLGDARLSTHYAAPGQPGPAGRVGTALLAKQTGERHARLRGLVARAFTPRQIDRARLAMRRQGEGAARATRWARIQSFDALETCAGASYPPSAPRGPARPPTDAHHEAAHG